MFGQIPPFALTERSGETFGSDDLRGTTWVASFLFTRCPDVCPMVSANMKRLQEHSTTPALVSFSVDPGHDDPATLARYAERFHAGPQWRFLTGPRDDIAELLTDGFRVAFGDGGPADQPVTHSDRLVLVDGSLQIRGYYHGRSDQDLVRLERDLTSLATTD